MIAEVFFYAYLAVLFMLLQQNIPAKSYSRIVSLVPSQTELLFYLGLENEVAGITKFCIHPKEWFQIKTKVGGTKNINLKTIRQLAPDLIIANKEENVREQVEELAREYDVWVTDVNNLQQATQMIIDIGSLTNRLKPALALVSQIKEQFDKLAIAAGSKQKIRAAYFIWKDPYMVAASGTFINDMMRYCGLENIFSGETRYPEIAPAAITTRNCDLILLSSEPYPFKEKHITEMNQQFPGVKIILVDGEMFSWYGNRLLKAANYFHNLVNLQ